MVGMRFPSWRERRSLNWLFAQALLLSLCLKQKLGCMQHISKEKLLREVHCSLWEEIHLAFCLLTCFSGGRYSFSMRQTDGYTPMAWACLNQSLLQTS